jgi:single-strand DNA-binding protein
MSINRAILLGHVGKDPEIHSSNGGEKIAKFSLATSETWKDKTTGEKKEQTEWHNVVVFNQNIVKVVEGFVKKGGGVSVEGKICTRKWQDKEGKDRWSTEIVIGRFDGRLTLEGSPAGSHHSDEHAYGTTSSKSSPPPGAAQKAGYDLDDEVPF